MLKPYSRCSCFKMQASEKSTPALLSFLFFSFLGSPQMLFSKAIIQGNKVTFTYQAPEGTKMVYLAGTFNGWNTSATPMKYDAQRKLWTAELELQSGEHLYKFVVNGSDWQTDPDAKVYSTDGYQNAVIRVGLPEKIVQSQREDGQIFREVILHEQKSPYFDLLSDGRIAIRLRANKNDLSGAVLVTPKKQHRMQLYGSDDYFDYYRIALNLKDGEKYFFIVNDAGETFSYRHDRPFVSKKPAKPFHTPDWAKNAVFYQIFPNSFANGDPSNDPPNVVPWRYEPLYHQPGGQGFDAFYGGDLEGVIQKIAYLKGLGISALYFTPVFEAQSTHKYNTADYLQIDDNFGNEKIFQKLLKEAHKNNIKIVLDGVFNHTGSSHFAFKDLIVEQQNSKYKDWYYVKGWPVVKDGKPLNYEAWWGFGELPKLNVLNPEVKKYLFKAIRKWGKMGLDGWRLDVANEVPHEFWKDFRKLVKSLNPEAVIIGEIWDNASPWLKGDQFDSVMNYRWRAACLEFFAGFSRHKDDALNESLKQIVDTRSVFWKQKTSAFKISISAEDFDQQLAKIRIDYPDEAHAVMLNLLDSHDRYRFLMLFLDDLRPYKLALFFQMTYPGAPCIYYGAEVGMEGGRDPDCRRAMLWEKSQWNREIYEYTKQMVAMRNAHSALRTGDFYAVYAKEKQYAYVRENAEEKILVMLNNAPHPARISLSWKGAMRNFTLKPYEGRIEVEPKTEKQK